MDFDVEEHLRAVKRSVSSLERHAKPARAVTLSRTYSTTIKDLWDAATNRDRIPRWFLPISGQLELNGRYQLEGNAGGVITVCEPPSHFAVTWEFGGDVSWLEVRLSDDEERTARTSHSSHTALLSEHWDEYGPGAVGDRLGVGYHGAGDLISRNRPRQSRMKPRLLLLQTASRSSQAAARVGDERPSRAARTPTPREQRHDAPAAFYTGESAEPA